jgi:hypothetical protein
MNIILKEYLLPPDTSLSDVTSSPRRMTLLMTIHFQGYGLNGFGFDYRKGQEIFPFSAVSRLALGLTQLPIQSVPGDLSPEIK